MWDEFHRCEGGVLIVGHGTRVASGVRQLLGLASEFQHFVFNVPTEASFLELAEPTIPQAMVRLKARGARVVLVVPILLFEAGHARSDIPDACAEGAELAGIELVGQSPPLGTLDAALALSESRFEQALAAEEISPAEFDAIGLAMVGRGSSDAIALDDMRRFTRLRIERSPRLITWVETGFFTGGEPTVDELLAQAAGSQSRIIVVQPHLLFEGELIQQLRRTVSQFRSSALNSRWIVAPPLGGDSKLAEAYHALASQILEESLPEWGKP